MVGHKALRLSALTLLVAIVGCNAGNPSATPGGNIDDAGTVLKANTASPKVVSVQDALPRPPKYSPYLIVHNTKNPYASASPSLAPSSSPVGSPSPAPAPSPSSSASPTITPSGSPLPIDYLSAHYVSKLLAGGGSGTPADGTSDKAVFGANGKSVGIALDYSVTPPTALGLSDGVANQARSVLLSSGQVTLLLGDSGRSASKDDKSLSDPGGLVFNASQKVYYVSDTGHHRIAQVNPVNGDIKWIAGSQTLAGVPNTPTFKDGKGSGNSADLLAQFNNPRGLAFDVEKTILYVADTGFHCIRKIDLTQPGADVTTIAGSGGVSGKPGSGPEGAMAARFNNPSALALSVDKKTLYIADTGNNCIRSLDVSGASDPKVSTLTGSGTADSTDGPAAAATFNAPCALAADKNMLIIGEQNGPRIRALTFATSSVNTVLGLKAAGAALGDKAVGTFGKVTGLAVKLDSSGVADTIYAYDAGTAAAGPRLLTITVAP